MTNADKMRHMSDEELAKWFCTMCNFGDFCPYRDDCNTNCSGVLKWLKEEVKDGSTIEKTEQWSKDHPIITNAHKFKEVFGFSVEDKYTMRSDVTDWLNKPYKEPKHDEQ